MEKQTNEIAIQSDVETSVEVRSNIVEETESYVVKKLANGKYEKQQKYTNYMSKVPETEEEQIELYKVLNSSSEDNDMVTELKTMVGKVIGIEQLYIQGYESFDEDTGESNQGVVTIIKDGEKYYGTSSKSVYFTLLNLFKVFGYPNTDNYKKINVKVVGTKRERGIQINLSLDSLG